MAEDLVNIRLSLYANEVAEKLVAAGYFDYSTTAAKFALAYALKNHFDEIDPSNYDIPDTGGSNYNFGSFDSDGQLAVLLKALYPNCTTPYVYARALMVFGLTKLGKRIDQDGLQPISSFL
ncbi:hypothetical protein [Paenibacillus lautus]|uniref:hypothetical protein n=1 Tax=Paenibacillus lautus TaxID=1401 RepID=UPI000BBDA6CE|nr:hypothetical protein [Paenibacillus lautus]PCL91880.1 hypothetical protein CPZ30_14115 [Paenibacillus lautus]